MNININELNHSWLLATPRPGDELFQASDRFAEGRASHSCRSKSSRKKNPSGFSARGAGGRGRGDPWSLVGLGQRTLAFSSRLIFPGPQGAPG